MVLAIPSGVAEIWIEGSADDGFTWSPLCSSLGDAPKVQVSAGGGLGPDQNLYRSDVVPFELADSKHGTALWLRVMVRSLEKVQDGIRLGCIRVEGMAEEGSL